MKTQGIVLTIIALALPGMAMRQPSSQPAISSDPAAEIASDSIMPNLFGASSTAAASAIQAAEKKVSTPVFSLPSGTYSSTQSVKIKDATAGSTIYYTTNGSTPTKSSTKYKAAISVAKTETLRAMAVASGHAESAVAKATYTLKSGSSGGSLKVTLTPENGGGTVTLQVGSEVALVVVAKNAGAQADSSITVTPSTTPESLPLDLTICETSPNGGPCLAAPQKSVKLSSLASGAHGEFVVFVAANGSIASSPANRIVVSFKNSGGTVIATGSIPVTTN